MKALIIGATGATGKDLVKLLVKDPDYTELVIFVRRPIGIASPRIKEVLTNFDRLEEVSAFINGDVWFSCLGTTLKTAGSKKKQWHIDYEIPLKFAAFAKTAGIPSAVLVSAYGAKPTSNVFYSQMKGKLEESLEALKFDQFIIFRPGMLLRPDTDRPAERFIAGALKFLNTLGLIKKFKPLPTAVLAEKLAKAPKVLPAGKHIISLDKIAAF